MAIMRLSTRTSNPGSAAATILTKSGSEDSPVGAISDNVHLLIALDEGTIEQDLHDLADEGVMIFDGPRTGFQSTRPNHVSVPLDELAVKAGKSKIMINSVATGAALACLGFELQPLLDRLGVEFGGKGKEVVKTTGTVLLPGTSTSGIISEGPSPTRSLLLLPPVKR